MITLNVNGVPAEVVKSIEGAVFAYNHCVSVDEPTMTKTQWATTFGLKHHHYACAGGYVTRKVALGKARPYEGKFGCGVIIEMPRWDTTRYHMRDYYLY